MPGTSYGYDGNGMRANSNPYKSRTRMGKR
jgi:hypothetical protein